MNDRTSRNIGLTLTMAGVLLNPWLLGLVFVPGGHVETLPSILFILAADLYSIAGGIWFLARRGRLAGKTAWFSLIILLVIPAGVEGGLHLLRLVQSRPWSGGLDRRLSFSSFRGKSWAPDLFREQHALVVSFEQYLGWRTREYHGTYLNIEADGTRRTINRPPGDTASGMIVHTSLTGKRNPCTSMCATSRRRGTPCSRT